MITLKITKEFRMFCTCFIFLHEMSKNLSKKCICYDAPENVRDRNLNLICVTWEVKIHV